ncbi:hypothetical protein [Neomegalonema perideroedes]|uniref:hypothetical protein n=1 Tax=Neomegalonema perideroedes TaxID=217219 RepID=UPI0003715821|nr:hypothetical protein [Neomegalonema perideroedes]
MMRTLATGCALAASVWIGAASAQSLTVEEIRAKVDQSLRDLGSYQELLADPDPARSSAAMKVMLESGDAELQKIALDYGLYSPNPAVRRKALEGFFASEPRIEVFVGVGRLHTSSNQDNYLRAFAQYGGSVDAELKGYFTWKLGKFDADQKCALDSEGKECAVRVTDSGVSLRPWGEWLLLAPNEEGDLTGTVSVAGTGSSNHQMRIPVRQ